MRHFPGPPPRRTPAGAVAPASRWASGGAPAAPAPTAPKSGRPAVAYDGHCGRSGDSFTLSIGARAASARPDPSDPADPSDDVPNSTISGPGAAPAARVPAYARTSGDGRDVFDLRAGLRRGGDQPACRLVPQRDAAWAGVFFAAVGTRKQ